MNRIAKILSGIIFSSVLVTITLVTAFAAGIGDIDENGSITASDARFILRASVGLEKLDDETKLLADVNSDGAVTASDARTVLRASVGYSDLDDLINQEHKHELVTKVTLEPTCTKTGKQVTTCTGCDYKKEENLSALGHTLGEWTVILEATVQNNGTERSKCQNCSYYKDRSIAKKEAVYYITADTSDGTPEKIGVAKDGKYSLTDPKRVGYNFKGWVDSKGKTFNSSGVIKGDVSISAVWELDGTDTLAELVKRAEAGTDVIKITNDITVSQPIYVTYPMTVYSDGDFTIRRAENYAGDIFVVGSDKNGNKAVMMNRKAVLNLGGGKGTLTIDGNRDAVTVKVKGSALFVADSSVLNIYDGVKIANNIKHTNERTLRYTDIAADYVLERIGGAAIVNLDSEVNMYGGIIDNNLVSTEYTVVDNGDGTMSNNEVNGCGGAIYCRGNFHMYGGELSNNEALRGGAIYTDRSLFLYSGKLTGNLAHTYGGAVSSASSFTADIYIGKESGEEKIIISNNKALRAGGALYSNTSSPIVIYGNAEITENRSDSSGGAVYTAGPLTVRGSLFSNNTAEYSGGAIYHHYTKAEFNRRFLELTDCVFTENEAGLGGAVILSATDTVTDTGEGTLADITGCTFKGNHAIVTSTNPGNGGAVYITRKSDATIKDCTFEENTAANNAGAVAVHSEANVVFSNIKFNKNTACNGGALYTSSQSDINIKNVEFTENSAVLSDSGSAGNGGALYYASAFMSIKNVKFIDNSAANNAGAIYQNASTIKIDETCTFERNSAVNHGGALYLTYTTDAEGNKSGSVLTADNTVFRDNSALSGGAISGRTASDIKLNNVSFFGNTTSLSAVSTSTGGGALYVNNSDVAINACLFDGNSSGYYGGAVRFDSCNAVINNTDVVNNSGGTGGAIYASGDSFTAKNLTLIGNSSTLNGVMYVTAKNAEFDSLIATDNTSVNGGVLFASKSASVTVKNSDISNNTANNGGAFYITALSDVKITATDFVGNNAVTGQGGAVYVYGAKLGVDGNSVFNKNTALGNGGAVSAADVIDEATSEKTASEVIIKNTSFNENTGSNGGATYFNDSVYTVENCTYSKNTSTSESYGGGALYNTGATGTVNDVTFTENTAKNGGAVAIYTNSSVTFGKISAINNTATSEGGAIYSNKCDVILTAENSLFKGNSANNGGAIYASSVAKLDIKNAVIEENTAAKNGGAVYVSGAVANISGADTVIRKNTAAEYGGAIYASYVTDAEGVKQGTVLTVDKAELSENTALFGGAVSGRTNTVMTFSGALLLNNSTPDATVENKAGGGAVYANNSTLTFSETSIKGNSSGYYGGAVYTDVCDVVINNGTTIEENSGATGGALYLTLSSTLKADNISIINNDSSANGVCYFNGNNFELSNIEAEGNEAKWSGGVFFVSGNKTAVAIRNSEFTDNKSASGGVVTLNNATGTIVSSEFIGNTATSNGGAVYVTEGKLFADDSVVFEENTASGNGGAISVHHSAEMVIDPESPDVIISAAEFKNNSGKNGGAVYLYNVAAEIVSSEFADNSAHLNGGAVDSVGSIVNVSDNCQFTENDAVNHGGAIYVTYINAADTLDEKAVPSYLSVVGGAFSKNTALGGGAVSIRSYCEAQFDNSVFTENTVSGYEIRNDNTGVADGNGESGGAIYVGFGKLTLNNVIAENNIAMPMADEGSSDIIPNFGGAIDAVDADVVINGGSYKFNKASNGGAIYAISNSDITITNAEFTGNVSTYDKIDYDSKNGGGAVNISGGSLDIRKSVFDGNKTGYYGGAVLAANCDIDITEGSVIRNSEGATGAAIHIKTNSDAVISDTEIYDNNSSANGIVYVNSSRLEAVNVNLHDNTSKNGGFLYSSGSATVISVKDSTITDNIANTKGGVSYSDSSAVSFTDCEISGNEAVTGGAICAVGGTVSITSSEVNDNNASNGGAVHAEEAATINVEKSQFNSNNSTKNGGVIWCQDSVLNVSESDFNDNTASSNGGAIYLSSSEAALSASVFTANSVNGTGGAIYLTTSEISLGTSQFTSNSSAGNGGAVYVSRSSADFDDVDFDSNTSAVNGGALNIIGSEVVTSEGCEFTNNTATNHGGSVYVVYADVTEGETTVREYSVAEFNGAEFIGNTAMSGGAVSIRSGCEAVFNDSVFEDNIVSGYDKKADGSTLPDGDSDGGGAVYVGYGKATFNGVTASGNEALETVDADNGSVIKSFGGFIASMQSSVNICDSVIDSSKASSGGAVNAISKSTVNITNSVLSNNESVYKNTDYDSAVGGGAVNITGGTLNIDNTLLDGNKTDYYGGAVITSGTAVNIANGSVIKNSTGKTGAAMSFKASSVVTIADSSVIDNVSGANGVLYFNLSTFTADNLTAKGNTSKNGGLIFASNSKTILTINSSDLSENSASCGGVLYIDGSKAVLNNCTVADNTASSGAVVYAIKGAQLTLNEGLFNGNEADSGAVVYSDAATVNADKATFSENNAKDGAGIYALNTSSVTLNALTAEKNNVTRNGAVIYAQNSVLDVIGSDFSENHANANGGAVYIREAESNVTDSEFTENSAASAGGAIYNIGSVMTSSGETVFNGNIASGHGGAVYLTYFKTEGETPETIGSSLNMTDGAFIGNSSLGGGAVSIRTACSADFNGTEFTENTVSGFSGNADGDGEGGGAVYVGFGELSLENCEFNNNTADSSKNEDNSVNNSYGGAVDAVSADVLIKDSKFTGNSASAGGAVNCVYSCTLDIIGSEFIGNISDGNAEPEYLPEIGGGAILVNKTNLTVDSTEFSGNKSNYYGGAIHASESVVAIRNNSVFTTSDAETGSALYFRENCNVNAENTIFSENLAGTNGTIYLNTGTATFNGVEAYSNTANQGGVLYVSGSKTTVNMSNCDLHKNSAKNGGVMFVSAATVNIADCDIYENEGVLGGAVYNTNGTVNTEDTRFDSNTVKKNTSGSGGNGGAVTIAGGKFIGTGNNVFSNNTAEGHAGAIYVSYSTASDSSKIPGELIVTGGLFEYNTALAGGAVSSRTACITTLNGTVLRYNTATSDQATEGGGAVYSNDNTLTLSGVTISGNTTGYYGGAVSAVNANVVINNKSVISENVGITGSALNFRGTSVVALNDITVSDNVTEKTGSGVIYATNSTVLEIEALTAERNKNNNGGVIFASGTTAVTVKNSEFNENIAKSSGGAICYSSSGLLTVTDCEFTGNTAKTGGAICNISSGTVEIISSMFKENSASSGGGAVYVSGAGNVVISENTEIISNISATSGGAVYHAGSGTVKIRNSMIGKNGADVNGGAVYSCGTGTVELSDNTEIYENTAPTGGAVCVDLGSTVSADSVKFTFNNATSSDGGAVLVADTSTDNNKASAFVAVNSEFTGNTAASKGGAISTDTASSKLVIDVTGCLFKENKSVAAGGGAVEIQHANCNSASAPEKIDVVFTDCTFDSNIAKTTGAAIEIRTSSCAKINGITAKNNVANENGAVFYVTSNYSRLYLTGTVTCSGNTAKSGNFAYLYNNKYSNPPAIHTSHANTADWYADVKGNSGNVIFNVTSMP